jgi:hypothetical protein
MWPYFFGWFVWVVIYFGVEMLMSVLTDLQAQIDELTYAERTTYDVLNGRRLRNFFVWLTVMATFAGIEYMFAVVHHTLNTHDSEMKRMREAIELLQDGICAAGSVRSGTSR